MASLSIPPITYPSEIGWHIAEYAGTDEEDILYKQAVFEHLFARRAGLPPTYNAHLYLDWKKRSIEIQTQIASDFGTVSAHEKSDWGVYNGAPAYEICGIDERELFIRIILQAPADQTDFYFLDIGAGDFSCGYWLAEYFNLLSPRKGITIHIINVRGEHSSIPKVETEHYKEVKLYRYGSVKIEELHSELEKLGHSIQGKVDLIVTRWCSPHLVDFAGTFTQAFNLLRPERGYMLGDGGNFFLKDQEQPEWGSVSSISTRKTNVIRLLVDTKAPMLMRLRGIDREVDQFILRRPDEFLCELPMSDGALEERRELDRQYEPHGSKYLCKFTRTPQPYEERLQLKWREDCTLSGTASLHRELKENKLIKPSSVCGQLLLPLPAEKPGG